MTLTIRPGYDDELFTDVIDDQDRIVATYWGFDGLDADTNARLFVAAEDLLAACEVTSEAETASPNPNSEWGKALIQLRAAIAAAKGDE